MDHYDVVVIGSGPAGATTARYASQQGLRVLMLDKKQELGAPVQCSGAVSSHALESNGVPVTDEFIEEAIYGFDIYNQDGADTKIDYRSLKPSVYGSGPGKKPLGYIVFRRRFDRYLMTLAEKTGTDVMLKAEAIGYEKSNGEVVLHIKHFNEDLRVKTKVIVGADGLQSQVGKWAGLKTHLNANELASCLQFVVDGVSVDGLLEIITGHAWAPGGYAWVFPKGHGYAEIGLGIICSMSDRNAQWHLEHFIKNSFFKNRFKNARVLEVQGGGVPLSHPLKTQFADNMILVGDAARHVNPITGGGIHTALSSGKIAGEFLGEFIKSGRQADAENLSEQQSRWMAAMGKKMWELYEIKSRIFKTENIETRNAALFKTMSEYFSPDSAFKKI
jgi:digeranylgeranylglycerophospholipid reductase